MSWIEKAMNGQTDERTMLLAEAEYCDSVADRCDDMPDMAADLRDEANRLRQMARTH